MYDPVLSPGSLYKNINGCNQQQEGEEKPFQYFFKPLQAQLFIVKLRNRFLQANSIPNRSLLKLFPNKMAKGCILPEIPPFAVHFSPAGLIF